MGKNPSRMVYKRKWRQVEKKRKWFNSFITEYTRLKFGNVYNEAACFYNALEQLYPDKNVKKTKEFINWKKALSENANNPESNIIVQTLYTSVSYGEKAVESDDETENSGEKAVESDDETENSGEKAVESDDETENSGDEAVESDDETENSGDEAVESSYHDNMLLEIPLQSYLPPDHKDKNTQTHVSEPGHDYEVFTDERFQQIVAELRNDPELRNIFGEQEQEQEEDEGVELRTLEEELEVDIEPFDFRLEVELADWENQL